MITESNDTILQANDSGLSSANPGTFSASGSIGDNPNVAPGLDVDLISLQLDAGDIATIDIDASEFGSDLDPILRLFDSAGNEVAVSDDDPAPGENFGLDSFIEFTASSTDTYYVGVSGFSNFDYDPSVEGSGFDGFNSTGDYDIEIGVFDPIIGTPERDNLSGTSDNDLINALGANDTVAGLGGDDLINGGNGRDFISGNSGDDTLNGENGRDVLSGNGGNDVISGGNGNDIIRGGGGKDRIRGNQGNDILFGDAGADIFVLDFGQNGETISDFEDGKDLLELPAFTSFEEVLVTKDNLGGSTVSLFGEVLATVQFTEPRSITAEDFIVSDDFA